MNHYYFDVSMHQCLLNIGKRIAANIRANCEIPNIFNVWLFIDFLPYPLKDIVPRKNVCTRVGLSFDHSLLNSCVNRWTNALGILPQVSVYFGHQNMTYCECCHLETISTQYSPQTLFFLLIWTNLVELYLLLLIISSH